MLTVRDNLKRTITAFLVFTAQQATGATAFAYYGPQYFKLLVGSKGNSDLLLTAIFGAVKVAACLTFVLFVAERVPRKAILIAGAAFMAACQISTAAVVKTHPAPGDGTVTSSGIATIALIYLFVIAYNFSWGPLPWPVSTEKEPPQSHTDIFAVRLGNLSYSHSRAWHRDWRRLSVAVEFCLFHFHALYDFEYQMGHLPALGHLRSHYCGRLLAVSRGDERVESGADHSYCLS